MKKYSCLKNTQKFPKMLKCICFHIFRKPKENKKQLESRFRKKNVRYSLVGWPSHIALMRLLGILTHFSANILFAAHYVVILTLAHSLTSDRSSWAGPLGRSTVPLRRSWTGFLFLFMVFWFFFSFSFFFRFPVSFYFIFPKYKIKIISIQKMFAF